MAVLPASPGRLSLEEGPGLFGLRAQESLEVALPRLDLLLHDAPFAHDKAERRKQFPVRGAFGAVQEVVE